MPRTMPSFLHASPTPLPTSPTISPSPRGRFQQARVGQNAASDRFVGTRDKVAEAFNAAGIKGEQKFSKENGVAATGDDVYAKTRARVSKAENDKVLQELAERGGASSYRVIRVDMALADGKSLSSDQMSQLAAIGGKVEKGLRVGLEGKGDGKLSFDDLNGVLLRNPSDSR